MAEVAFTARRSQWRVVPITETDTDERNHDDDDDDDEQISFIVAESPKTTRTRKSI